jgi:hypothetical protein
MADPAMTSTVEEVGQNCPGTEAGQVGQQPYKGLSLSHCPTPPSCAACRFWKHVPDEVMDGQADSRPVGECRRNAPAALSETRAILHAAKLNKRDPDELNDLSWGMRMALWPTTWCTDFCGDFRRSGEAFGYGD